MQVSGVLGLGMQDPILGLPVSGVLSLGVQKPLLGDQEPSWGAGFGAAGGAGPLPGCRTPPRCSFPCRAGGNALGGAWALPGVPREQEAGERRVPPNHHSRPKLSGEKSRQHPARGSGTAVGWVSGLLEGGKQGGSQGHGVPPSPVPFPGMGCQARWGGGKAP